MIEKRAVTTLQSTRAFIPVITFRWLVWALALGVQALAPPPRQYVEPVLLLLLVGYTAAYTLLWTLQLPALARSAARRPILLLADLLLSLLPAWLSGGWSSPFVPFALGALLLPGALFHWRGMLVATAAYFFVDQIGNALSSQYGAAVVAWPTILVGYTRPLIAAAIWPLSVEVWRRRTRHPLRSTPERALVALPGGGIAPHTPRASEATGGPSSLPPASETGAAWSLARARSQTIEHPLLLDLRAAIRQAIVEAEVQGLTVDFAMEGTQPPLPPDHVQVLAKAVEVGLANVRCHAHTCEAQVRVKGEATGVLLTIRDHGTGLFDGTAEPPGFRQIKRLRYRLQEIEGTLDVREEDSGGVVLTVRVPC